MYRIGELERHSNAAVVGNRLLVLSDVANGALIVSLVAGVLSTGVIVWTAKVKEFHGEANRRESSERIALLDAAVAEANARAAEANQKAEEDRLARVKIEERLAPWEWSSEQRATFISLLRDAPKGHIAIEYIRSDERRSYGFAMELKNMMETLHYDVWGYVPGFQQAGSSPLVGIMILSQKRAVRPSWWPDLKSVPGDWNSCLRCSPGEQQLRRRLCCNMGWHSSRNCDKAGILTGVLGAPRFSGHLGRFRCWVSHEVRFAARRIEFWGMAIPPYRLRSDCLGVLVASFFLGLLWTKAFWMVWVMLAIWSRAPRVDLLPIAAPSSKSTAAIETSHSSDVLVSSRA